jgi:hypothetical protein
MADDIRKTNPLIRYGILVFVLGVFLWNYIHDHKPLIQTGRLEYRMVTGIRENHLQVILLETADRFVILDSAYREILISEDGELISRPKQLRLLEKYQNIEYRVGFSEESSGLKPGYRVTREVFNELRFGELMKYEVNKKQRDSLVGLAIQP